jgi:predicted GH43/DUF377 family glycosyl hydrolase
LSIKSSKISALLQWGRPAKRFLDHIFSSPIPPLSGVVLSCQNDHFAWNNHYFKIMKAIGFANLARSASAMFCSTVGILLFTALPVQAALSAFGLVSPQNGDHFEVAKPLLFWESSPGASHYDIFIDDVNVGVVQSKPVPVMNYTPSVPVAQGNHTWYVNAVDDGCNRVQSSNSFSFKVEAPNNWPSWAIGPFVRFGNNPILTPQGTTWEAWNVYNPGVIFDDDRFRMLYRGQDLRHKSRIGYAESLDGVTFTRNATPVIDATESYEKKYGCEDARISKYRGVYYSFYTGAYSNQISLCEATSTDAMNWTKLGVIQVGTKNGALICDPQGIPVKIDGKFAMFTGNGNCGVCYSDNLTNWSPIAWFNMHFPKGWVGPWEPCVAVADYSSTNPQNIVLFIAGTLNGKGKWYYAISEALFSKTDLTKKVDQLNDCIFQPRERYESGTFTNCLWMNSILLHDNQWWMHYGAGDRNIGLATAPLK